MHYSPPNGGRETLSLLQMLDVGGTITTAGQPVNRYGAIPLASATLQFELLLNLLTIMTMCTNNRNDTLCSPFKNLRCKSKTNPNPQADFVLLFHAFLTSAPTLEPAIKPGNQSRHALALPEAAAKMAGPGHTPVNPHPNPNVAAPSSNWLSITVFVGTPNFPPSPSA